MPYELEYKPGVVEAGQVPPERLYTPEELEEPTPEKFEDISQDGGGQLTAVVEPYRGDVTIPGVERELEWDRRFLKSAR